jgi:hypothetical protein
MVVSVGNSCKVEFWESAWLDGRSPRDIAPGLYRLAWRKHQSIKEDMHNDNWTRDIWRMSSVEEMAELIVTPQVFN